MPNTNTVCIFNKKYRLFDISVSLGSEHTDYPGDPEFKRDIIAGSPDSGFELSALSMSSHCATHIDFPSHFIKGAKTASDYSAGYFIMPAYVVQATVLPICANQLNQTEIEPGCAVLFKTLCSDNLSSRRRIMENNPYFTLDLCRFMADSKVKLAGIDYLTPDKSGDRSYPVHKFLLGRDILLLENIRLDGVEPGKYVLLCMGLKVTGSEAVPARAVLLKELSV